MKRHTIGVLGGSGFVGHHLAQRLIEDGHRVRILTRHPHRHRDLLVLPGLELVEASAANQPALTEALRGCDVAVNLVGILNERGDDGHGFERAHVEVPRRLVQSAWEAGATRVLHLAALNAAADAPSHYLRSKFAGEQLTLAAAKDGLRVTSFRPSVIFGPGDSFLNRFAGLLRIFPWVFPLACPEARFAPVFVGDVAEAMARALDAPESAGRSYELCGPRSYSLRELVQFTARSLGLRRRVLGLPDWAARLQAALLERVPGKPFSRDNYRSLQLPSVCHEDGLGDLGITATALETAAGYLGDRGQRGRYDRYRRASRRS